MKRLLPLVLFLVPACNSVHTSIFDGNETVASEQFEFLKGLEGRWAGQNTADGQTMNVESHYKVSAEGSAVIATLFPGQKHEMVTVFHRDGGSVLATHYCSLGNQPRMRATGQPPSSTGPGQAVQFNFVDSTNLRTLDEPHMGSVRITRMGDTLKERWTSYKDGKIDHETTFTFTKKQ